MNDAFRLVVQAARPVAARSSVLLVPLHKEVHPRYGTIEITEEHIALMARHFTARVKTYDGRLPFTLDHDEGRGAAGWITGVQVQPDGLWGDVEWTKLGVEAVAEHEFPFISPELLDRWTDPVTGKRYQHVFEGAALVVRPEFRELPPAVLAHYKTAPEPTVVVTEKPGRHGHDVSGEPRNALGEFATVPATDH